MATINVAVAHLLITGQKVNLINFHQVNQMVQFESPYRYDFLYLYMSYIFCNHIPILHHAKATVKF